jgi:hypothetical protein
MRFTNTTGIILSHIPIKGGICMTELGNKLPYCRRTIHYYLGCLLDLKIVIKKKKIKEDQRKWFYFRVTKLEEIRRLNMEIPDYEVIWNLKTLVLIHSVCKKRIEVKPYKNGYLTSPIEYQKDVLAAIKKHTCKK